MTLMKKAAIYIHGMGGNAEEAYHYSALFPNSKVIGFNYESQYPWDAEEEFGHFFENCRKDYDEITVIANSIGAYFSLCARIWEKVNAAVLISPVVDMEQPITNMMKRANVTEDELKEHDEIPTDFGETLSYRYLTYSREHPTDINVPAYIIYGENDDLTSLDTITHFVRKNGASLFVCPKGEHWFHNAEQMRFIDDTLLSIGL